MFENRNSKARSKIMESVPGFQSIASSDDFQTVSSTEADPVDHLEVSRRARGKPEYPVQELLLKKCCSRKEVTCFKKISQASIESCRDRASFDTETKQNQFVIDYLREHSRDDNSVLYAVSGHEVCETCWRYTYGFRYAKFKSLKEKFQSGVIAIEHGLTGRLNTSETTLRLLGWMRSFFGKVGDRMPMCDEIHLPSCLTKHDVYDLAKDDLTQGGLSCCSPSHLYAVWKTEFPNVKIPKENRFSMCDICAAIKDARERTLNSDVRRWLTEVMEKHVALQKTEREKYAKHRTKAEKHPSKYISIIVDGMDQNKTNIPHIISNPKAIAGAYLLETHVTGLRAHGRKTIMALDCNDFKHDSNLTIEVILKVLTLLKDSLSRTMYVQLDNTCRDNKNKYTLMFMFLLVEYNIFDKIKMGFLPVGHTHEDIDQVFSCISRKLKHSNALTIPALTEVILKSFSPQPVVYDITQVLDVKSWMKSCIPPLHDHLKAHQFKFEKVNGTTRMYYKEWSSDKFWLPQSGINMLSGCSSIPSVQTQPLVTYPFFEPEVLDKLEATLKKASAYLERSHANVWWTTWLLNARRRTTAEVHPLEGNWLLKELAQPKVSNVTGSWHKDSTQSVVYTLSGVEMESPHVQFIGDKECIYDIPGIGVIATSWIGKEGREELFEKFAKEIMTPEVQRIKKELQNLASVCLRTFQKIEMDHGPMPDAISLCQQYAPKPKRQRIDSSFAAVSELWKETSDASQDVTPRDNIERATEVLGERIVDTITAASKDPPHIYIGPLRGKKTVLENRHILKELKRGMLVAVESKDEIPRIGEVMWIQPNPTLDSKVAILLYEQEKSPHKPKWQRYFKKTAKEREVSINSILLYDFSLTSRGAIRKSTREYLQTSTH